MKLQKSLLAYLVVYAFTLFFSTAVHAITCQDLFQVSAQARHLDIEQRTWSQMSARGKLIEAAKEFYLLPLDKRSKLRHRAFTETVDDVFRELETIFLRHTRGLTREHRMALQFGRDYFELLKKETAQARAGGEINLRWASHVGAHAARISDILARDAKNLVLVDWYRYDKELRAYAQLRGESKSTKSLIQEAFNRTTEIADRQSWQNLLVIPSTHMFSPEGVVELIANGVHTLGFFAKVQHSGLNGRKYYDHDRGHAGAFYSAAVSAIRDLSDQPSNGDFSNDPLYHEFKKRLLFMSDYLKSRPDNERKAGFAVLFYAVHEAPLMFMQELMGHYDFNRLQFLTEYLNMAEQQLSDSTDLGYSFPRKWWWIFSRYSVKDPEKIAQIGATAVTTALREYHRSQGQEIDR